MHTNIKAKSILRLHVLVIWLPHAERRQTQLVAATAAAAPAV
jgi:hypothetical protein